MPDVAPKYVAKSDGSVVQFVAIASNVAEPPVMVVNFVIVPRRVSFPAAALPVKLTAPVPVLKIRLKAPVRKSGPPVVDCCSPPIPVVEKFPPELVTLPVQAVPPQEKSTKLSA